MRRLSFLLPAAALAALASLAPVAPLASGCAAVGPDHAALVVEHGDGSVVTRCVAFAAGPISGEELLNESGVAWSGQTFAGFGEAVCALDGEPAQYAACPGKDSYWAVFVARGGGAWQLSSVGISSLTLGDGDAEGFRYVPASGVPAVPAAAAGVCPAAASAAPGQSAAASAAPASATPASTPPPAAGATHTAAVTAGPTRTAAAGATPAAQAATPAPTEPPAPASDAGIVAAAATQAGTSAPTQPPASPAPAPSGGVDAGLLLAALAGGALAGLAILRLVAGRRPGP